MSQNRSLLLPGLSLTLRRLPAFLWTFFFNFVCAALATAGISRAIGTIADTSLNAQPLHHGFDLGTALDLSLKIFKGEGPGPGFGVAAGVYLAAYFLLVPGTLLCYLTSAPARLSTLLQAGLLHFWRFVRILLLTLMLSVAILGVLGAAAYACLVLIDDHMVGWPAFLLQLACLLVVLLVAAFLRLYFDLVEVYTVQLGLALRPDGRPDRRVRRALGPAFRTLRKNFSQAYGSFLLLVVLGGIAAFLFTRASIDSLAQPRVWPMFLFSQGGLFLLLFSRFWQRGAEAVLVLENPITLDHSIAEEPVVRTSFAPRETPVSQAPAPDPIPAPEPSAPSLDGPDPAVFHHDVQPAARLPIDEEANGRTGGR